MSVSPIISIEFRLWVTQNFLYDIKVTRFQPAYCFSKYSVTLRVDTKKAINIKAIKLLYRPTTIFTFVDFQRGNKIFHGSRIKFSPFKRERERENKI